MTLTSSPPPPQDLRRRTFGGVVWSYATFVSGKGAAVLTTVVLARLLTPSDFGLVAVGLLCINYLDRVKDLGIGSALIHTRDESRRTLGTGITVTFVSTTALSLLAFAAAPLAADFFHNDDVTGVVRALAVAYFVSGLGIVPDSRLRRSLDFRRRTIPEVSGALVKGGVSIALAVAGFGAWSLVWGQVAGTAVVSVLDWWLAGIRPFLAWDGTSARDLLRYGLPLMAVAVLGVVVDNLDYLVVGRRMGERELGLYTLAYRVPELLVLNFLVVVSMVLFPSLSALQHDRPAMRRAYLDALRHVTLVTLPLGVVVAGLAPETITVLFGPRWEAAIVPAQLLAIATLLYSISFHAGDVYKAIGRPGILNTVGILKVAGFAPVLWWAAGHSLVAVAATTVLLQLLFTGLKLGIAGHVLDIAPAQWFSTLRPALVCGGLLAVLLVGMRWSHLPLLHTSTPPWLRLAVLGAAALLLYAGCLRWQQPDLFRALTGRFRTLGRPAARTTGGRS
ncbi:MAG TPA: lipopolysaccharide biosynthesis protein [Segeticoccus sp.]|uniref:lipopolysaccharide biosynthesis protein n=1 Tax=Segeticoccus sp. TaxID=2706531 RepID=UPI002D7F5602|nr:lipopolysaccharide biosynthesis protein [Segeticoccus sp.]HET8599492.1 lipopolysaccharide biosynthesis protein [Segeticoccus sp.]